MNKSQRISAAQGTIEYLVIIAVIVVIGLVGVGFISSYVDTSGTVGVSSSKISSRVGVQGISVLDAIVDPQGDGLITIQNSGTDALTVNKIRVAGVDNNYSSSILNGDSKTFSLSDLNSSCVCAAGQSSKTCEIQVTFTNEYGVQKTEVFSQTVDCVGDAVAKSATVSADDSTSPTVILLSPTSGSSQSSRDVNFVFNASDNNALARCELLINGSSDTNKTTGLVNGTNFITKTLPADLLFDWNVSCYDYSSNRGNSSSFWNLDVDANDYQVTTCLELQDMNLNLSGNYVLMNDINCLSTLTWNSGAGFLPVGCDNSGHNCDNRAQNYFTGSLDGNRKSILRLYVNRPSEYYDGLFGQVSSGKIMNVNLVDFNVVGGLMVGGVAGRVYDSNITGVRSTGYARGSSYVGGVVGYVNNNGGTSLIQNSYFEGNVTASSTYAGGIAGTVWGSSIKYNYSKGYITGADEVGGIVGVNNSSLSNSFSVAAISSSANRGGVYSTQSSGSISSSYWDTSLTGLSKCHNDGNSGCTATTNQASSYYGASGIPFANLGWSTSIWQSNDSNYPTLK